MTLSTGWGTLVI